MRHRRLPRLDLPGHTYYLTCCTDRRQRIFANPAHAEYLIHLYVCHRDQGFLKIHGYVVMPDHYHVVLTLLGDASLSGVVRAVHSLFARHFRKTNPAHGRLWQRRFYDRVIRSESDLWEKIGYMHNNPVKVGLVRFPDDHLWSSFSFWATGSGAVPCDGTIWDG
jgi:putative transposase